MWRCIQLAKNSGLAAAPNPVVGCVVVYQDQIIGEGFTSAFGGPHAEVNAINSVEDKSLLPHSTLYVSLEPCSHYGKTPPCAELIIKYRIPRVVIGIEDPHEKVAGSGIKKLKEAGAEVRSGILEGECRLVNKRFFTYHQENRPYIILKWAESADGFLAPEKALRKDEAKPYWISNPYSRQLVHQWRTQEQSILVGSQTVLDDDPQLNSRKWYGASPLRVVLDSQLSISADYHIFNKEAKTLIIADQNYKDHAPKDEGYRFIDYKSDPASQICLILKEMNILSCIVEGGAATLKTFIDADLWDEARVFRGDVLFGGGLKAPDLKRPPVARKAIGTDQLFYYHRD